MKVIFLDIDGVMNSNLFYRSRHKKRWFKLETYLCFFKKWFKFIFNGFKFKAISMKDYKPNPDFGTLEYTYKRLVKETDKNAWINLIQLVKETGAKICISSVWKNHFNNINDWSIALERLGFDKDVFVGITPNRETLRGTEIQKWMDMQTEPIENYVIIDDDSDMLPEQMGNFFQTDTYCGLTPNTCYRIKRHFSKQENSKDIVRYNDYYGEIYAQEYTIEQYGNLDDYTDITSAFKAGMKKQSELIKKQVNLIKHDH